MANIIDTTYFQGVLTVAQKSEPSVIADLQTFIDIHETKYLKSILGYELWKNFTAGIAVGGPAQKWLNLRDGAEFTNRLGLLTKWEGFKWIDGTTKRSPIANYIYYWWLRKETSTTTGTGEKRLNAENSESVSSFSKQCNTWNEMVGYNRLLWEYLYINQDAYPEYFRNGFIIQGQSKDLYTVIYE